MSGRGEGWEDGVVQRRGGRTPATVMAQVMSVILRVVHNVEVTHLIFAVWAAGGDEENAVWSSVIL